MDVSLTNSASEIISRLNAAAARALEMCGATAVGYAKIACPVDTGNLRGSIDHKVDGNIAHVGTNVNYAAYVEMGTGSANVEGGTGKASWVYKDAFGNWHRAYPQKPRPYLKPAIADHVSEYEAIVERVLRSS